MARSLALSLIYFWESDLEFVSRPANSSLSLNFIKFFFLVYFAIKIFLEDEAAFNFVKDIKRSVLNFCSQMSSKICMHVNSKFRCLNLNYLFFLSVISGTLSKAFPILLDMSSIYSSYKINMIFTLVFSFLCPIFSYSLFH